MTIELTENVASFLEETLYIEIEGDYEYIQEKHDTAQDIPEVMSFMDALVDVILKINPERGQECADMYTECLTVLGANDLDEVYELYGD